MSYKCLMLGYELVYIPYLKVSIFVIIISVFVSLFRMGPMDSELKQRKRSVGNRKRTKPGVGVKPEEVR